MSLIFQTPPLPKPKQYGLSDVGRGGSTGTVSCSQEFASTGEFITTPVIPIVYSQHIGRNVCKY